MAVAQLPRPKSPIGAAAKLMSPLEDANLHPAVLDQVHGQEQPLVSSTDDYCIERVICHSRPLLKTEPLCTVGVPMAGPPYQVLPPGLEQAVAPIERHVDQQAGPGQMQRAR